PTNSTAPPPDDVAIPPERRKHRRVVEGRIDASSESNVFAGKDGGVRHPHDSGSICPGRWADMNIEGPYLGQLDTSFSARRDHLGATPEESATRCSTGLAQVARFCRDPRFGLSQIC